MAGISLRASIATEQSLRWSRNAPTIVSPTSPRALAASPHSSWCDSRSSKSGTSRRLRSFPTDRIASRATSLSASASSVESSGSKESGSKPSSRAASSLVRWHSAPCSQTMPARICCAVSRFWAGPGRARNATMAERTEKSGKSPTPSISSRGSTWVW